MAEIEIRGVPTVYVATVEFTDASKRQERALGTNLASVFVEHPIQDRTDEEMLDIAERAFEELLANLVSG
jgi:hypothetical protein